MQTNPAPLSGLPAPAPVSASPARTIWPPVAAAILLLLLVGGLEYRALVLNDGHFTYSHDDPYLHMAIAKNLVRHGIWGFSALDGFNSSDSSLVFPWLLAACGFVFGDRQITPLIVNLAASSAALFYAASILRRFAIGGWRSFLILAAVVLLVPLPAMISTGMEHSVEILVTLAFMDVAARLLADDAGAGEGKRPRSGLLLMLGCLLTSTRYEGLFLIGIVGLMLLWRRRWLLAVLLGVAAAAPLVLFGWYSVSKGWYPLPNSVLLKGNTTATLSLAGVLHYITTWLRRLVTDYHMLIPSVWLFVMLAAEWRRQRTLWTYPMLLLTITAGAVLLHLQFADIAWFARYEAYLLVPMFLLLGVWLSRRVFAAGAADRWSSLLPRPAGLVVALLALVSFLAMAARAGVVLRRVPIACHNIYEQQFQMAWFVRQFYSGKGVAANDIGAIDYFAEIHLFDTFGLANVDVLRARRANHYDHAVVEREMERYHVRVVMVYDIWAHYYGGILPEWTPVGRWSLKDNIVCAAPDVTFYAPDPTLVPELTHALQEFAPLLPASVVQTGLYRDAIAAAPQR